MTEKYLKNLQISEEITTDIKNILTQIKKISTYQKLFRAAKTVINLSLCLGLY